MSTSALRQWTRLEFLQAVDAGVFRPDEHLELLDGQIVMKMTQNAPHVACTQLIADWLRAAIPSSLFVRSQFPIALGDRSQPEPDVAVVTGSPRDYVSDHPSSQHVALVVEVADSSIREDQRAKVPIYAQAGIAELWVVDLNARRLTVYTQPEGREYGLVRMLHPDDEISAPLAPDHTAKISDLLPY